MACAVAPCSTTVAQPAWQGVGISNEEVTIIEPTGLEPTGVEPTSTTPSGTGPAAPTMAVDVQDLPQPLSREEIDAISRSVATAIVPVRATQRQSNPLLSPAVRELEGFATAVRGADGEVALVTASGWLEGADQVTVELADGRPTDVVVSSDARFGLAILEPEVPLPDSIDPLTVLPVEASRRVEVLAGSGGDLGGTLGTGRDAYAFYQVNSLGVVMGYPLVNRQGQLVGVGSHRYPLDPALSLSVPGASVLEFMSLDEEP